MNKKILLAVFIAAVLAVSFIYAFNFKPFVFEANVKQSANEYKPKESDVVANEKNSVGLITDEELANKKPLTVDDLLDERDRTEETKLRIQIYDSLTKVYDLYSSSKNNNYALTVDELKTALDTLVEEAYLSNQLALGNAFPNYDAENLSIEVLANSKIAPYEFRSNHIEDLNDLILGFKKYQSLSEPSSSETNIYRTKHSRSLARLFSNRFRRSQKFYMELATGYLLSEEYSMPQKLDFAEKIVSAGDPYIMRNINGYFKSRLNDIQSDELKNKTKKLVSRIEKIGGSRD